MNSKVASVVSFLSGCIIGSAITAKYLEKKYDELLQKEINSVKEVLFSDNFMETLSLNKGEPNPDDDYQSIKVGVPGEIGVSPSPYTEYLKKYKSNSDNPDFGKKLNREDAIKMNELSYITYITPDEYGIYASYDQVSLIYFSDGVLVDEMDNVINDISETLGSNFEDHFGENDDPDVIYIRNDNTRCEYEVTRDCRTYKEVVSG